MATKKKTSKKAAEQQPVQTTKNPISQWIFIALSLLSLALVFVKGEAVWAALHTFVFGIFGLCSFFVPFILIYVAVVLSFGKVQLKIKYLVTEICILIALLAVTIETWRHGSMAGIDFFSFISDCYISGATVSGGGFIGGLIASPLLYAFGVTCARITAIILLFTIIMITTGTTLPTLLKRAKKPVAAIKRNLDERKERKNSPKFNVDVPLGDEMPDHPVRAKVSYYDDGEHEQKRQKLIDEYTGKNASAAANATAAAVNAIAAANGQAAPAENAQSQPDSAQASSDSAQAQPVQGENIADLAKKVSDKKSNEKTDKKGKAKSEPEPFLPTGITVESATTGYKFPDVTLLNSAPEGNRGKIEDELRANAEKLVNTLRSFGVETRITDISRGPSVTRYELQPSAGVKISRITNLCDDIALNLAAGSIRIEAPIPNKSAVGIEVPNRTTSMVSVREIIETPQFMAAKGRLTVAFGRDIDGRACVGDLAKMPHLLIAGTTGSGKSVCINSMIISLLYKSSPDEIKLLMVDPKVVELGIYNGIPHLLVPVVTDPKKAAGALGWAVSEMLKRYNIFAENQVRDLASYNQLCKSHEDLKPMPQIVIIIDELSDLMMAAPHEVEDAICRLAQMARAAGMHLVVATQRPSADVITGIIKSNIPSRVAFSVSSGIESRIILDSSGADKLLGKGDMLYFPLGMSKPLRVQGCFVDEEEVKRVVDFIKNQQGEAEYDEEVISEIERQAVLDSKSSGAASDSDSGDDSDERFDEAVEVVIDAGLASTSLLQRKLKLGYARAARIMDQMEEKNIIGPYEGSKPRKVLLSRQQWLERQALGVGGPVPTEQPAAPQQTDSNADFSDSENNDEFSDQQ